jgi:HEPN domain-containing protein
MLAKAREDLAAIALFKENPSISDEIFGFHAQQAVEKALKAWILSKDIEHPHTHDLNALLGELGRLGELVADYQPLIELNPFAIQFRYEEGSPMGAIVDRGSLLLKVSSLVEKVEGRLKS